jgi:nucleotide-binding universal stress UspA family protein
MIKLLAYTDGKSAAVGALQFAAELAKRLDAELAVITVRPGTHAAEEPPPVGVALQLPQRTSLPGGLRALTHAMQILTANGALAPSTDITIRDIAKGHMFVCSTPDGRRVPFYECFGHLVETLNNEVDAHGYDLLIIAPPRRGKWGRRIIGNTTRRLALDLHTSLLVVRDGGPDSRYLVCADGSAASRRQFPLLERLLPAITTVELLCVQQPDDAPAAVRAAMDSLGEAQTWLARHGKSVAVTLKQGGRAEELVLEAAGNDAVIVMGASLRHDVYRRLMGSLPLRVLARTSSSVLLAKQPPG